MSPDNAQERCDDGQLSQAQPAVTGRDQTMPINAEATATKPHAHFGGQQGIKEYPPAQDDRIDSFGKGRIKVAGW